MARDINDIRADLKAAQDKHKRIHDEWAELLRSSADGPLSDGERERSERLERGAEKAAEEVTRLHEEWRDAMQEGVKTGRFGSEHGDGPKRGPEFMRRVDPYEPDGLELARSRRIEPVDAISRAKAAVEHAPEHMDDKGREHVTRLLEREDRSQRDRGHIARHIILTGSPEYHRAFEAYVAGRQALWDDEERRAMRLAQDEREIHRAAMSLTDANGGYLVPFTLDPTIILTNAGIAGPLRRISRIEQTSTDTWNPVTSSGVTAEWTAEGVEWADATPTFGQPTITPKKADAWIFGSYEVLADSGFAAQLGRLLADAKVRLEEAAFATANTGATRPRGVVAAVAAVTASIVTAAATNAFAIGDLYRLHNATTPRADENRSWIANKSIFTLIRQFDTSGSGSFWTNLGGPGVPPSLLGSPAYECSTMVGVVSTGANILLGGNFGDYVIVDRVGMTVVYDPVIRSTGNNRPTGQAGWAAFWRVGADIDNPDSFRLLQLNTVADDTPLA